MGPKGMPDTKTDRPTDRRSQHQLNQTQNFKLLLLTGTGKRQTRPLVREGAPQRKDSKFQTELISGHESHSGIDTKTLTVSRKVTSASAGGVYVCKVIYL
jgi:hypothetical protein